MHTKTLFLGRMVSEESASINLENVEKVTKWPVPKSVKDVEKFLGFINYQREHIKDYAKLTSVLYKLTGSRATFSWESRHQDVFETLKQKMVTAPILSYPIVTKLDQNLKLFHVDDASTVLELIISGRGLRKM